MTPPREAPLGQPDVLRREAVASVEEEDRGERALARRVRDGREQDLPPARGRHLDPFDAERFGPGGRAHPRNA